MNKSLQSLLRLVFLVTCLPIARLYADDDTEPAPPPPPQGDIHWKIGPKSWTLAVIQEPLTGAHKFVGRDFRTTDKNPLRLELKSNRDEGTKPISEQGATQKMTLKASRDYTVTLVGVKTAKMNKAIHFTLTNGENSVGFCLLWNVNTDPPGAKLFIESVKFIDEYELNDFIEYNKPTGASFTIK